MIMTKPFMIDYSVPSSLAQCMFIGLCQTLSHTVSSLSFLPISISHLTGGVNGGTNLLGNYVAQGSLDVYPLHTFILCSLLISLGLILQLQLSTIHHHITKTPLFNIKNKFSDNSVRCSSRSYDLGLESFPLDTCFPSSLNCHQSISVYHCCFSSNR